MRSLEVLAFLIHAVNQTLYQGAVVVGCGKEIAGLNVATNYAKDGIGLRTNLALCRHLQVHRLFLSRVVDLLKLIVHGLQLCRDGRQS